jgi:hypothetical protein
MLTYLRYALATFCFAASVGCLALWWRSITHEDRFCGPSYVWPRHVVILWITDGFVVGSKAEILQSAINDGLGTSWEHTTSTSGGKISIRRSLRSSMKREGQFRLGGSAISHFPLWYPAFVFALAGVAALRLGRRFTLRSANIATTIVAGLLGMAVGL